MRQTAVCVVFRIGYVVFWIGYVVFDPSHDGDASGSGRAMDEVIPPRVSSRCRMRQGEVTTGPSSQSLYHRCQCSMASSSQLPSTQTGHRTAAGVTRSPTYPHRRLTRQLRVGRIRWFGKRKPATHMLRRTCRPLALSRTSRPPKGRRSAAKASKEGGGRRRSGGGTSIQSIHRPTGHLTDQHQSPMRWAKVPPSRDRDYAESRTEGPRPDYRASCVPRRREDL